MPSDMDRCRWTPSKTRSFISRGYPPNNNNNFKQMAMVAFCSKPKYIVSWFNPSPNPYLCS